MDGRAYNKLSDGKLIGVFNRTGRKLLIENRAPWKRWERTIPNIPDFAK